jgi:integrase
MRSTFSVIFYLKKEKLKKDGTNPIMGRITVDGTMAQFSCKLSCDPAIWEPKGGHAKGKTIAARDVNRELDKIKAAIVKQYQHIMMRDSYATAEKVKNAFLGLDFYYTTLMTAFDQWIDEYKKPVEAGLRTQASLNKYKKIKEHLQDFMKLKYNISDIALKEIQPTFAPDFEMYLRADKHLAVNTTARYVCGLLMMLHRSVDYGWVDRYPFSDYHVKEVETEKGFLTKEELHAFMNVQPKKASHCYVRDLYVFCCFTGLAYADLKNLKDENIVQNPVDNSWWIRTHRHKTGVAENVKLLPIPLAILKKYKGLTGTEYVFNVPPYYTCSAKLKSIKKKCGITKRMTWHMARHTMATVVCLSNGVPLEVVKSILGHKSIESTQIYAKITQEKLGKEIDTLASKLSNIEEFTPGLDVVLGK